MTSFAQDAALDALRALKPQELFDLRGHITSLITDAEYPQLQVVTTTDEDGSEQHVLLDADGTEVTRERLVAIDVSKRWTYEPDLNAKEQSLHWEYGFTADYEGLTYAIDGMTAVRLPAGWTEE